MPLDQIAGSWDGTSGFRLMPADPLYLAPATAEVVRAAGGHLTSVTYTWAHPDDGSQDGLLVVGPGAQEGQLIALWGDSWHQNPRPMVLTGALGHGGIELVGAYGSGWNWRIAIETRPGALRMRMDNVVPASRAGNTMPSGPYSAMVADLQPLGSAGG